MTSTPARLSPYQRRLLFFLSIATFFEGYDFLAITQILPNLRSDMNLTTFEGGLLVSILNVGTVLAYVLVKKADHWGRRRLMTVTIVGYTLLTFLSGLAPNIVAFTIFQFLSRIFLLAEYATSNVYAAEEFPKEQRGRALALIQLSASLGGIVCAGLVPVLITSPWGWRTVYLVGIVPLVLLAFARRSLQESRRFAQAAKPESAVSIWRTPYRWRVLQVGSVWILIYACGQAAVTFWKEFTMSERGFTDAQVGEAIALAAFVSLPLVYASGRLLDLWGRRWGATAIFVVGAAGIWGSYSLHGYWPLTFALVFGIFGTSATLPVVNAFTTELFPTELRAQAYGWANNAIGRISYVVAPLTIAFFAEHRGWSRTVPWTAVFMLLALGVIWKCFPETKGLELEQTSSVRHSLY